ncbi:hypothetical protein [Endozoicomonas sp. SCSIO W0465]|uniref:hypothetical protein n=1 Tax=Endozoicomonas sp. SCSIO W0465 TaxID=2918516 RepID=UPI002074B45B|nr:hypothetical protein [Endozoicomonas sp. SCSIO W0465]USE35852.1 hypothetical protein MJO57_27950 [Endozoicomonas sp. SCSIO W0465]
MNIAYLEKRIKKTEALLDSKKKQLAADGDNFALSLSIHSLEQHIDDLHHKLSTEKGKREKEVIELRLVGADVNNGSVPLDLLANLAKHFSGLVFAAAAKFQHGQDMAGAIPNEITQPINLRFAEIGHGSSRLYITGDTSPDLFGVSLLENSLSGLFDLLNQDMNQGLSEQVDNLGLRSSHSLAKFLKVLRQKHIEIDIRWTGGNEQKYAWHGRRDKIQMLETLLDGFSSTEPVEVKVDGIVELISRAGKLDIRNEAGELIKIRFSKKMYEAVRPFRMGDTVTLLTNEKTVFNSATQEKKKTYSLISIDARSTPSGASLLPAEESHNE